MECNICKRRFIYRKSLLKHIEQQTCTSCTQIVCKVCDKSFMLKIDYDEHVASAHENYEKESNVLKFQCELCFASFARPHALKLHRLIHSEHGKGGCRCPVCGKILSRKDYLPIHMKVHNPENHERVQCKKCGVSIKRSFYKEHIRRHFEKNRFACSLCPKRFKTLSKLNLHYNIHTGDTLFSCDKCNFHCTFRSKFNAHMAKHASGKYACNKCQRVYKRQYDLNRHLQKHEHRKIHRCRRCGKSYKTLFWLRNHEQAHTVEKKHQCDQCQRSYITEKMLRIHKSCHKKPFVCGLCSLSFIRQSTLMKHIKIHTVGNVCPICNKSFRRVTNHLIRHKRETVYECKECNCLSSNLKTFKDACKHVKEKLPRCQLCKKVFLSDYGLSLHVKRNEKRDVKCFHTTKPRKAKPKCRECNREFSDIYSYRQHMESHDPNKQFCCEYCHERFYSFTKLYKHLGKHNG